MVGSPGVFASYPIPVRQADALLSASFISLLPPCLCRVASPSLDRADSGLSPPITRALLGAPIKKETVFRTVSFPGFGRGGGIRTRDPLHPMQVRCQAALRPEHT